MSGFDNEILYCDGAEIGREARSTSSSTRIVSVVKTQDDPLVNVTINSSSGTLSTSQVKAQSDTTGIALAAFSSNFSASYLSNKSGIVTDSNADALVIRTVSSQPIEFYNDSLELGSVDSTGQWTFPVKPLEVSSGGTGKSSITAYSPVFGGTTSTGDFQNLASIGTAGQALVSNGAGSLPSYQNVGVGSSSSWNNLGISYSSPTFTINDSQGSDLSSSNPGYITLPSKANPGQLVTIPITANETFDDASGTSDIIGNLFGFTTSVAITVDVPFFIYAVVNDDEDDIQFMISRIPGIAISPPAADIGAPDDAVADQQNDFWSLSNINETLYDQNPCICIGGFRMRMDGSDDWTVQALSNGDAKGPLDGIGSYFTGFPFEIPLGQFGADSGTLCLPNGGTCAVFSTVKQNSYTFLSKNSPYIHIGIDLDNDGGTDGAGGVSAEIVLPFILSTQEGTGTILQSSGFVQHPTATECILNIPSITTNFTDLRFVTSPLTPIQWGAFTNGDRRIFFNINGRIRLDI